MELILIGGGKTAYFLARQFIRKGHHLTLIANDPSDARWLAEELTTLVILGDGSDPAILEEAEVHRAEVLLALTPCDQDNLVACQLARQMYGVPRTLALVNDPDNEAIFTQLGVTIAISPAHLIASLIEQQVGVEERKTSYERSR